jgi:hypothetical protein
VSDVEPIEELARIVGEAKGQTLKTNAGSI